MSHCRDSESEVPAELWQGTAACIHALVRAGRANLTRCPSAFICGYLFTSAFYFTFAKCAKCAKCAKVAARGAVTQKQVKTQM
jgi:hypothetical protein